ncbi:MAG TPA: hypothetical protein DCQ29_02075 [Chitinophagaceae bacterium]|nr:hypothetical protein [Chitinophagaceae bacterium]
MAKLIKNLKVFIEGEDVGALVVAYDLNVTYDDHTQHPDNSIQRKNEYRSVESINRVELQLFHKVSVDILPQIKHLKDIMQRIENEVLETIESNSIEELMREAKEVLHHAA